ncbi:MAG: 3-carboxy-cis,cis-muconate cycloisomerase [Solirubrobacteraceae bacterium]|nr:3-carboxy-cis,cis-muconate cycloisomerase [Solirubrobacteraceae bacterium]
MLDVEAALARALQRLGELTAREADAVVAACEAGADPAQLDTAANASPVVGLARILRERAGDAAHRGATSQDILDTALMLVARRALEPLADDARAAADAAAKLARAHRDTPVMARTLLQHALPTSFGLKAAGWMHGIDEAAAGLDAAREEVLAVQMGGPVGHRSPEVAAEVAADLGLTEPVLAWHGNRTRPAALAAALGVLAGALAKVARDVTLLAQGEVGEVREGGAGGASSAMAHKRNPVASVSVLACAARVPGLAATVLSGMAGEHERAAGAWQAEWGTLTELLRLTGSAAAWARELLEELEVDTDRMRENLKGAEPDLGASGELVDRALLAHGGARR